MSWVKVDDHASEDEQLCDAGGLAAWYDACAQGFCRRKEPQRRARGDALDFVPDTNVLGLCAAYTPAQAKACVAALVRVGLWVKVAGGYRLAYYLERYQREEQTGTSEPPAATSNTEPAKLLAGRQLGGVARAQQALRGPAGRFQQTRSAGDQHYQQSSPPAGPAKPASRASDPNPDPDPDLQEQPTTQRPESSARVGVGAEPAGTLVACPADLRLTDDQRGTLETSLVPSWAIEQLELRFRANHAADPSDTRTLTVWRKCLGTYIARTWNDPRQRPKPEDAARPPLARGQRQPNTLDHLDDQAHAAAIGARLE